jgi:hypothetical protein
MTRQEIQNEMTVLHEVLLPVLSKATIGDFDSDVDINSANSQRVNEILMGVQVLLEVIRQQSSELEDARGQLRQSSRRGMPLLDEVLRKPLD